MKPVFVFTAALAVVATTITAPSFAQNQGSPAPRHAETTARTAARSVARQPAAPAVQGVGCSRDAFGALRCSDGANLPGGQFGVTVHADRAAPAPASGRTEALPDPAKIIRDSAAQAERDLYGDPSGPPRGEDGYGCRTDAEGQVRCD
ncbi:hypothetical protein [Amaricoccus solimangrovi]|uniref:Excalibur calcium-binding domain-containing protein n=1 Tax=Amaricoccus solimangrovi TaxID=2589815 RepID=A0A501WHQ2_9RHOB|nr:hypothetical protein [Amaricoccus solimangrovi]TPE46617.1 hypothetical protein FJM51_21770 [Amaricoccus solimangrovi]